jgi:hypothetical protein
MLQVNLSVVEQQYFSSGYDRGEKKWEKLLTQLNECEFANKILPLETILDSCGFDDALAALGAVKGHNNAVRLFACYCAGKAALFFENRYPRDRRLRDAIGIAERYARGLATKGDLSSARKSLMAVHNDICSQDDVVTTSQLQLEQLYCSLNPVATCVNANQYEYTATPDLDFEQLNLIVDDVVNAINYFIRDAITVDGAIRNTGCSTVVDGVYDVVIKALMEELTAEFRRLCRLDGKYGIVKRKKFNRILYPSSKTLAAIKRVNAGHVVAITYGDFLSILIRLYPEYTKEIEKYGHLTKDRVEGVKAEVYVHSYKTRIERSVKLDPLFEKKLTILKKYYTLSLTEVIELMYNVLMVILGASLRSIHGNMSLKDIGSEDMASYWSFPVHKGKPSVVCLYKFGDHGITLCSIGLCDRKHETAQKHVVAQCDELWLYRSTPQGEFV